MEIEIEGLRLTVCQDVYPPSEDTYLLLDGINDRRADVALEVGSGTGIATLKMASNGSFVVASDIDPKAAHCTKLNAKKNGLSSLIDVVVGDSLSPFRDQGFNLIVFNPPYLPTEDRDVRWSGGPNGREVLDRFINEVCSKLKSGGILLLIQSTLTGVAETLNKLRSKGMRAGVARLVKVGLFEEIVLIEALRLKFEPEPSKTSGQ
ncbi:MAG: methyltransferase [Candidatus Nezhaarchaeales archaeon]